MTDYQGSTIALIDSSQQVAAKYSYTPYGTTTATGRAAGGDPFRWIGGYQNTDNHGTYNLGYRQYDPKLARFTQPDPSGQESNPYAYGLANPISNTDPAGLVASPGEVLDCTISVFALVGTVATAVVLARTFIPKAADLSKTNIFGGITAIFGTVTATTLATVRYCSPGLR